MLATAARICELLDLNGFEIMEEEDSLAQLVGSRRGKLGACTRKMNEIKEL